MVGVSAFGGAAPGYFGTFDVAFFTLLLVTAGDPWPEAMPRLNEDGSANWPAMAYCACYIIVSTWLILQVPRRPGGPGSDVRVALLRLAPGQTCHVRAFLRLAHPPGPNVGILRIFLLGRIDFL